MTKIYPNFGIVVQDVSRQMRQYGQPVHTEKWQGFDIKDRPEAEMRELLNVMFQVHMPGEDLQTYRDQIEPNLPWADDHFEERVCGEPLNPGVQWANWPWANKADESRQFGPNKDKFSHTYMERYWPVKAGDGEMNFTNFGTRFSYGDLDDVVDQLWYEPHTRQAYLPIFFPEDTGALHGNRVPCTLGYHFIQRNGYLHIYYPIRSCDFYRHFRDDLYLTSRLLLWVLNRLRSMGPSPHSQWDWNKVQPGLFTMWVGSLHCFINDYRLLYKEGVVE